MKCTMKNAIPVALTLTVLLAGCVKPKLTRPNMTGGTESVIPTQRVSATEAEVLWTETGSTAEVTEPAATEESASDMNRSTQPQATERPAEQLPQPTQPSAKPTETTTPATEPKETEPSDTKPAATESTEIAPAVTRPPATKPPENELPTLTPPVTEPEKVEIDTGAIESYAGSYAASLGFVIDHSLGKGNSGYYPPDYRPLLTTSDGYGPAAGLVSATKNQLNSRFSSEKSDVLVEGAYGLARMNCLVEYSHTDELGDWYYIYVFYG